MSDTSKTAITPPSKSAPHAFSALSWEIIQDYLFLVLGALVQAIAMRLFLVPALLVSGGVSGAGQIVNYYTNFPIGFFVLLGNVPLFILGWRYLGGARFAIRTAGAILFFSLLVELLAWFIPEQGVVKDLVLNSIYGGVLYGVGLGLVYRGKGTSGGSDILGLILHHRGGVSISQAYMLTDTLVVLAGGFAFGWDRALYGLIVIYVSGLAAEAVSEGGGIYRSIMVITNHPEAVANQIMKNLERGVTFLQGVGAYTGMERLVLYCVVTRSEVNQIKSMVQEIDPQAFMVVGQANEALGEGFRPLQSQ